MLQPELPSQSFQLVPAVETLLLCLAALAGGGLWLCALRAASAWLQLLLLFYLVAFENKSVSQTEPLLPLAGAWDDPLHPSLQMLMVV